MTTDNTNEAAKIAGELSAEVLSALQTVANGNSYMSDSMWNYLEREGLVESTRIDGKMVELITSHGLAVLAVSAKAPQRETEITAAESNVEAQTFAELCEREILKIRTLTLKDDEYTGDLLADAVGSPVGVTMCVEARMRQIADLKEEIASLKKQNRKLKHKSNLDDGFIDYLSTDKENEL